jgi:glycosyltransferase involved in cell wall biosynthesis
VKLLSVNMTLDPRTGGGSAARTLQATRVLAGLGVSCTVATADEGFDAALLDQLDGISLVKVPCLPGRFRIPVGGFAAVRQAVREADVVMLVNHWTFINVLAWRSAVRFGVPYVICPAGALPSDGGRSRHAKSVYNTLWGRAIVAGAAAHIAVTRDETAQFLAYGVDPAQVTVIPNGMPAVAHGDAGAFRARHGLGAAPVLLFMGRLAPIKGPDLLIDAFARCAAARPDWHLVCAGPDDGMLEELKAQVTRARLGARVHFTGFLDAAGKADALAAAELVVVPSRREAMSIVVLEAASTGRPVLVTDRCGVPDVAESGSGWVATPTVDGLATGLLEATSDRITLAAHGIRWRDAAMARYAWSSIGQRYLDLFARVLAEHRR